MEGSIERGVEAPPEGSGGGVPLHLDRIPAEHRDLFGVRTEIPYTDAERQYSAAAQMYLEELLSGNRHELVLLRRYHADAEGTRRIAVMSAPPGVNRSELRLPIVERILISTISFVRDTSPGGPILQRVQQDQLVEIQHFSTKYPHIIIEREDLYDYKTRAPLCTEWRLRRTQNQRQETQINRWLDTANLALSLIDSLRGKK